MHMANGGGGEIQDKLRKSMLFRYLKDDALKEVLALSEIVRDKADDRIISEGEVSTFLYTVLEGNVNVFVRENSGKEIFVGAIGEGEVFGEAGIFLTVKRTANIVSGDNTMPLRVDRNCLLEFIQKYPTAGVKMLLIIIYGLLRKLRESNQELAFERKSVIAQDDIDDIVENFMKES
jgi:CRP/FNR family transcriptional regulator, cyclic AMP receptor protein